MPHSEKMHGWRRIRFALIVIVEGILLCTNGVVKSSTKIVEMIKDLETFEEYPWGRKSFKLTL